MISLFLFGIRGDNMVTHFVEDVTEIITICGLTLMKDRLNDDTSLDINDDTSLDISDCTCPQCLSLVIGDLTKRLKVTHFVKDVVEMATICGLTSMKDRPNDDTSLNINDCTCQKCLSLFIADLTKRLQNIKKASVLQVQSVQKERNDGNNL
jgi:hypothetical protein